MSGYWDGTALPWDVLTVPISKEMLDLFLTHQPINPQAKETTMHTTTITLEEADTVLSKFGVGDLVTFSQPLHVYRIDRMGDRTVGTDLYVDLTTVAITDKVRIGKTFDSYRGAAMKMVHPSGNLRFELEVPAKTVTVSHKYAVGDSYVFAATGEVRTITGIGWAGDNLQALYEVEGVNQGKGNTVALVDGHPDRYPPAPPIVSTTTITVKQYSNNPAIYGDTARELQAAVAQRLNMRTMRGERWVIETKADCDGSNPTRRSLNPETITVTT